MTLETTPPSPHTTLWTQLEANARTAGLDPSKFTAEHQEIVKLIVTFLAQSADATPQPQPPKRSLFGRLFGYNETVAATPPQPVPPIIICGVPGTGKTTFLYVLDQLLRSTFALPDGVGSMMHKHDGRELSVPKRTFAGASVSLLSVRKWAELLHFYHWDTGNHRFVPADQQAFIEAVLRPMRVIFADEVEMAGYSPLIPDLASNGILVVGTSNQYQFSQLADQQLPPRIYRFEGVDMRAGDPADAVVDSADVAWPRFDQVAQEVLHRFEHLKYRYTRSGETVLVHIDFRTAVEAPLLETQWTLFFHTVYKRATASYIPLQPGTPFVLLLDDFALATLLNDYNAIIRYVSLLDSIEQLQVGLLLRNREETPALSRAVFEEMKTIIQQTTEVREEIRIKTLAGIDRSTSRLGQAGASAKHYLFEREN